MFVLSACGRDRDAADDGTGGSGSSSEGGTSGASVTSSASATTATSATMTSASSATASTTASTTASDSETTDTPADSSSGDPPEPIDPDALDDSFDDPQLPGWTVFRPEAATATVTGGQLRLEPVANTVWLDGATSILLWKEVAGDFKVTVAVQSRDLDAPSQPPPAGYRFGGVMARSGAGGPENYVFVVLGTDTDPSVESKSTTNSGSTYQGPPWPSASGEVRICRVGSTFEMYVRDGGAWMLTNSFERPDLPQTLQVGPIAYNNAPDLRLRASFDGVDFEPVASQAECAQ